MADALRTFNVYMRATAAARRWGLFVTTAGFEITPPGCDYPNPVHPASHQFTWARGRVLDEYHIVYVRAGEGVFESKQVGERKVEDGTVMVLFPGVWHRYRPARDVGWEEYWVGFNGEDAERFRGRGFIDPADPLFHVGRDHRVLNAFLALLERMSDQGGRADEMLAASVWEILGATLASAHARAADSSTPATVRRAIHALESERGGPPNIEDLAESLDISASRLHHLFKKHVGVSPYQYYLESKLNRAMSLLRGPSSVKQIASTLGFRSVYHFSTLFKKKTGLSPSAWRARTDGPRDDAAAGGTPSDVR